MSSATGGPGAQEPPPGSSGGSSAEGDTVPRPPAVKVLALVLVLSLLSIWWSVIVLWYLAFGLFLAPYRLVRRGSRKRKRETRMHRETLEAIRQSR